MKLKKNYKICFLKSVLVNIDQQKVLGIIFVFKNINSQIKSYSINYKTSIYFFVKNFISYPSPTILLISVHLYILI